MQAATTYDLDNCAIAPQIFLPPAKAVQDIGLLGVS